MRTSPGACPSLYQDLVEPTLPTMDSDQPNPASPPSGLKGLIAEKPWLLLVGYMVLFVGLSFASLAIALANPPQSIGGG